MRINALKTPNLAYFREERPISTGFVLSNLTCRESRTAFPLPLPNPKQQRERGAKSPLLTLRVGIKQQSGQWPMHCLQCDFSITLKRHFSANRIRKTSRRQGMTRALLVIDVQREYFEGALPISHPVGHLESILATMDEAAKYRIPTVVVRHHQPAPDSPVFRKNSDMWQLHAEVATRPYDILIDKQLPGSFTNTSLEEFLKSRAVDTVCITGYMTQICCDTTARQAFHRGYQVEFLSDATGTLDVNNKAGAVTAEQLHRSILVAQQMFISDVIDRSEWNSRIAIQ
jgi:nicotinamidase-related amidase